MLTASYMTPILIQASWMPGENRSIAEIVEIDLAGGPIDAPECISAGSHQRVRAITHSGEYGLPSGVLRDNL
jgi:hypothetical protein